MLISSGEIMTYCGWELFVAIRCMALVVRNNIKYKTMSILENGYGISLRFLLQFAVNTYSDKNVDDAVYKAISVILFKLEGHKRRFSSILDREVWKAAIYLIMGLPLRNRAK